MKRVSKCIVESKEVDHKRARVEKGSGENRVAATINMFEMLENIPDVRQRIFKYLSINGSILYLGCTKKSLHNDTCNYLVESNVSNNNAGSLMCEFKDTYKFLSDDVSLDYSVSLYIGARNFISNNNSKDKHYNTLVRFCELFDQVFKNLLEGWIKKGFRLDYGKFDERNQKQFAICLRHENLPLTFDTIGSRDRKSVV